MKNQFFFDMHPPLGKLMFAFTGIVSRAKFHLSSDKGLMLKTLMVANLHLRSWYNQVILYCKHTSLNG